MKKLEFSSFTHTVGHVRPFSQTEVKNEPMLFNCDYAAAYTLGGVITKVFLTGLPMAWQDSAIAVDSKVHMLMPGMLPCIGGWHHDNIPRTRVDNQPNYDSDQIRSEHIMMLVGGEICATEFALGHIKLDEIPIGKTVYQEWDNEIETAIALGHLFKFAIPSNSLVAFNDHTWHRGVPATGKGWRFFIRASRYFNADGSPTTPNAFKPITNEQRHQVQIYTPQNGIGW